MSVVELAPAEIPLEGGGRLEGELQLPEDAKGIVLFAHGSGSSRFSARNQFVARRLREAGIGKLLFDLLTEEEGEVDFQTAHLRFDISLLADRLRQATAWISAQREAFGFPLAYFGASTGAAAALVAAARGGGLIRAVVSRGGRPDLADEALPAVAAPTLLIVGGRDETVLALNREALARLRCEKELKVVPGATHLFEEPGTLEQVADLASEWFGRHLRRPGEPPEKGESR